MSPGVLCVSTQGVKKIEICLDLTPEQAGRRPALSPDLSETVG